MHWNDLKFCHLFTIISCKYTNSEYREIQPYHFVSTIRIIWCAWKLLKLSKTDVKKLGFGESELLSSHKLQVYNIFFGHFANFNDSIIFLLLNFFRKFSSEYEQFAWFVQFKQIIVQLHSHFSFVKNPMSSFFHFRISHHVNMNVNIC